MDCEDQKRILEGSSVVVPFFADISAFLAEETSSNVRLVAPVNFSPFSNFNFSQGPIYAGECSQPQNMDFSKPDFSGFTSLSDHYTSFQPLPAVFPHHKLDPSNFPYHNQNHSNADSWSYISHPEKLKVPKLEKIEDSSSIMLYNAQNNAASQISKPCSSSKDQLTDLYTPGHYLPMSLHEMQLLSRIQKGKSYYDSNVQTNSESYQKWLPSSSSSCHTVEEMVKNLAESNFNMLHSFASIHSPKTILSATDQFSLGYQPISPPRIKSQQARKRIGDKFKTLEKLLPWKERMDRATMLEKAHDYVRFLKAQVCALQSMPEESSSSFSEHRVWNYPSIFDQLTRHQLFQILVTSPAIQTNLCKRGLCIFSMEQVMLLKFISEQTQTFLQQQQQQQQEFLN